jgi:lipopolysaccharide export system permease protein
LTYLTSSLSKQLTRSLQSLIAFFTFKKLDWYILRQYLGPFLVTFFLSWFVLIMNFLWKYIDDLIGKGISTDIMVKFMSYASASLIPMTLPLAILLSSIMVMGSFGENSELTAAKSSGISLFRFFKSTIVFSIFIAIFAFFYSNFIFTRTESVFRSMLTDLRTLKPSLLIKPKQFYGGISGMGLRVDAKNEETGELFGIKIYNHNNDNGNPILLVAQRGNLAQSDDENILILKLDTVTMYKDEASNSFDNLKFPFYVWSFDHYEKRLDLRQFKLKETSNNPDAMYMTKNIGELNGSIDSITIQNKSSREIYSRDFLKQNPVLSIPKFSSQISLKDSISKLTAEELARWKAIRSNRIRNVKNHLYCQNSDYQYKIDIQNLMKIEWHRKFSLAISCIVLFFVGAPLGAIIKKGGIGLPMILSIVLFIIYYFSGTIGEQLARSSIFNPAFGMWVSTIIFLPLGIFLTFKARNDSQLLNLDGYTRFFVNLWSRYVKRK